MSNKLSGLQRLESLHVVPAQEFFQKQPLVDDGEPKANAMVSPFIDDREYRFCKAVVDNPLQPSSHYPKHVKVSTKTAITLRQRLIDKGFIKERTVDSAHRGRSTILLEASESGI